jgi:hypothetical protein
LQTLLPDFGLPDLFLARLEMLAGRDEYARGLLLGAVEKDLTWSPDSELLWLKISGGLDSGRSSTGVLMDAFSVEMPYCVMARDFVELFLPAGGRQEEPGGAGRQPMDARARADSARALLRFGAAMQEHGLPMVENLVGGAIIARTGRELEKTGGLTAEERALVKRSEAIRGEVQLLSTLTEEVILSDPGRMSRYVENLLAHGELRAARRGFMDYLAARVEE